MGLVEGHRADRLALQVAAPLAAIVVDLQVSGALAADLEHIALPERRKFGGAGFRGGADRGVVLDNNGERRGEGQDHCELSALVLAVADASLTEPVEFFAPMRLEPMN